MKETFPWRRYLFFAGAAFFSASWQPAVTHAVSVERLVMPGEVIQGHARYEDECNRCHESFSKTSQRRLCLACHKGLAIEIKEKTGFHGRNAEVDETECKHCHTDHEGRDADIMMLDKELFNHKITDFSLKGGHVKALCTGCHNEKLKNPDALKKGGDGKTSPQFKYRDAPSRCIGCHKEHDRHLGRLGDKCADCHEEESWSKTRYDHNKTKFPLKGKHKEANCQKCHPDERWAKTPGDCFACHRLNDHHAGRYGKKCGDCHTPEKKGTLLPPRPGRTKPVTYWRRYIYNHDKTKFPLKFKHRKVDCDKCHTGTISKEKLPLNCYGCHKNDDAHKDKTPEGQTCERCHNQRGWRTEVFFDHDLTRFPLIGLHAVAPCEECHVSTNYEEAPLDCIKCHESDDDHKQRLGIKCGPCHNPNSWSLWQYDHNSKSQFKLDGAHQGLECHACHQQPVKNKIRQSMACSACHMKDDEHRGRFGRSCQRCHITESFKEIHITNQEIRRKP